MEELFSLFQLKGQMLFLAHQAVTGALEHIHLQLHLSVFFLGVLNFVPEQIKRVLDLLCPDVIFFELSALNGELTLVWLELLSLLRNLSFILGLSGLQLSDFSGLVLQSFVEHLDVLLSVV